MVGFPSVVLAGTVAYAYSSWFTGTFGTTLGVLCSAMAFIAVFIAAKRVLADIRD